MKTKAAVLRGINKPLSIEELEVPVLKRGQVLVKIKSSGLCGSQLNEMLGNRGEDKFLPHLMGHEGFGTVVDVGSEVTKVKPYDDVVLTWIKSNGLEGGPKKYGECNAGSITTFQEYSVISENRLVVLNSNCLYPAMLGCMVPTGVGSVMNFYRGGTIRIFGAGNIGSASIIAAKHYNTKVYVVDVSDNKLNYALSLGADVVNRTNDVLEKTDFAVDTTGSICSMEKAFGSITDNGILVLVGNPKVGTKLSIDPYEFIKGKVIYGSWGGNCKPDIDIPKYADLKIYSSVIVNKYKLDDINEAIRCFLTGVLGKFIIED